MERKKTKQSTNKWFVFRCLQETNKQTNIYEKTQISRLILLFTCLSLISWVSFSDEHNKKIVYFRLKYRTLFMLPLTGCFSIYPAMRILSTLSAMVRLNGKQKQKTKNKYVTSVGHDFHKKSRQHSVIQLIKVVGLKHKSRVSVWPILEQP